MTTIKFKTKGILLTPVNYIRGLFGMDPKVTFVASKDSEESLEREGARVYRQLVKLLPYTLLDQFMRYVSDGESSRAKQMQALGMLVTIHNSLENPEEF